MEKGLILAIHKVLIFAGIMLLAYLYKVLSPSINEKDGDRLTKIVYNITLPLLLLYVSYTANIPKDMWLVPIIAFIAIMLTWVIIKLLFAEFVPPDEGKLLEITATMGNTAYMGYPIVESLLGVSALTYAVAYNITQTTTFLTIIYPTLGGKGKKKKILSPPLIGFIIGFLLRFIIPMTPPSWASGWDIVISIAETVGKTSSPLIMLSLGLITSFRGIFQYIRFLFFTFIGKFVITPVVHLGVVLVALYLLPLIPNITHLSYLAAMAIMLQATMPVMMASVIYASGAGLDSKKAAAAVTLTTVASLMLIPVFYWIIRTIF
ncbi:hypothetical protein GM182_06870 [bacterium 3DAC]|nr:hypothetical protein GM182_06870 [bacterium 3DAC]